MCCVVCSQIPTHSVDGFPVRHETKGVLKDTASVEDRQRDTHDPLQFLLNPAEPGASMVLYLVEQFVFPKGEDGDQMGPGEGMVENMFGMSTAALSF